MFGDHDRYLLADLIGVCRQGAEFYNYAATRVENSEMRSLIRELANVRAEIATDLKHKPDYPVDEVAGDQTERISKRYNLMHEALDQDAALEFLSEIDRSEVDAMNAFREGIHKVESTRLAHEISGHLATLQVMRDQVQDVLDSVVKRDHGLTH